tara:strand:- start:110 stop:1156 length:1047 start_codon:yes stop_codon:yes gene_type:complete
MKIKKSSKSSFFKKILLKLVRKLGYEMVDQSNLNIADEDLYIKKNLSKSGDKSITIPLGETTISRKVESLTIIIRSYTFGDLENNQVMLDQNKSRIFESQKCEYTYRTINSVIKSCNYAKNYFKDINFKIIVTDDKSEQKTLDKINSILNKSDLDTKLVSIKNDEFLDKIEKLDTNGKEISKNMLSNMRNIYKSLEIAENENSDLFYILEDDYIHEKIAISEMLFTYEKLSSQLNKELFLCPADYPYLYSNIEKTSVFFGNMRHWRQINETLITFFTSKKMLQKYKKELVSMCTKRHHPMEKKLHEIYEKEICLSPIPSLSMHCTNINSIYGIPPNFDWKKVWEENEV